MNQKVLLSEIINLSTVCQGRVASLRNLTSIKEVLGDNAFKEGEYFLVEY